MSTGLPSLRTTTVRGLTGPIWATNRFWSLAMCMSFWSLPSVATKPTMMTTTSASAAAARASSRLDRSSATVIFVTIAEPPRPATTSRIPSIGGTVYSGITLELPPPPRQASSTNVDWPTTTTDPTFGSSGRMPPSFFSRTAISVPIRRATEPWRWASISPGS